MNTFAIIGLFLAVIVLAVGAYRGLGALASTLLASLVVILTNGISIWQGFSEFYMNGYVGAYAGYFLLLCCSSMYANFMSESGSATSIAYQFIDWFGRARVLLVCYAITVVLTYGGISLFVVIYALAPIAYTLFKEANLPRHLIVAATAAGSSTITMTSLPGTPALTNVIPTEFLGTTLTAAPIFGIVASIAFIVMTLFYFNYSEKKVRANNECWVNPEGFDIEKNEIQDRSMLPSPIKAFLPIIILLSIIVAGSRFGLNSTMLATGAMLAGTVVVCVLNLDKFKGKNIKKIISSGLEGGIGAIGGFAGVVAFGAVVSNSQAFASIVDWVLSLKMNPYTQGVVATSVVSAITGSSSGGLRIMFSAFTDSFLASGANLDLLHRLVSISAGALDTLPHSPGIFLTLAVLGLTHKNAYKHIFVTTVVIPTIITVVSLAVLVIFF
ncbi:GntP family permease [Sedimentibacter hydroxybenzoicus DSM 7310]|uniref:GntP family permease n=1 Tax=Sedimentibacter hydroxybenzoicus DSM 7310 TaxID=1123245 RepID=A0A974GWQ6_SEDHY|nr:SLC13 family permease [Sedimentibacter hydroxybenzoicus]NYB74708.1 GntP family permease [Sedimentibacter hydroxybenzoicus DSM 7310]